MSFPHLSEVLKILDGALKSNASMSANYAGLLADKLELDGQREQAIRIRERLARVSTAIMRAQNSGGISASLPVDSESRLHTVDLSDPVRGSVRLHLSDGTRRRVNELIDSVKNFDKLQAAGAASALRMLLYGPPGTGKTCTARWVAGELQIPLLTVRCDTLMSSLLGQTSKNLRRVFEYAEQRPCVLFLDEFDALASARGNERDVGELQRVVIALLQNIDSLSDSTILLAASNHERLLDAAVWRRFPFRVPIPLPDTALRRTIWADLLGDMAGKDLDFDLLALRSSGLSGAVIEQVALDSKRTAILSNAATLDSRDVYRRLSLAHALNEGQALATVGEEVRWLRAWDPKVFTIRELARLYNISTRQINHLREGDNDYQKRADRQKGAEKK